MDVDLQASGAPAQDLDGVGAPPPLSSSSTRTGEGLEPSFRRDDKPTLE